MTFRTPISVSRFASTGEMPASPPPEVLDAIGAAAAAWERLEASGQQVRFTVDQLTGKLAAELADANGRRLRALAPGQVLEFAAGGTPR
jgi:hypothetical protein